jgi:dephospho-CoA kinase
MVLGIMGGYCAGKDAVARLLSLRGFSVIDVDAVGHEVLAGKAAEVVSAFGQAVRAADGGVDRKVLGGIVFSDPAARLRLEKIVHPRMVEKVEETVASARGDVALNAAILFRMGLGSLCDAVLYVTAPLLKRLARALRRDGISLPDAVRRIFAQRGIRPKSHDAGVDIYSIRNRGTLGSLERSVLETLGRIKRGKAGRWKSRRYSG